MKANDAVTKATKQKAKFSSGTDSGGDEATGVLFVWLGFADV